MKPSNKEQHSRVVRRLLLAASAACTTGVFGQPVVDPGTQPFMTLAPYVLQSSNLEPRPSNEDGGTRAFRPWFENGSWTGDLIEYEITQDGLRLIRGDIGRYPRDGADWRGTQELWSARYAFPDYQPYNVDQELDENWECVEETEALTYWQTRNVFTVVDGVRQPFWWDMLSDAQRSVLDSATAQADPEGDAGHDASPILNFVRGDRSNERCKQEGLYRWRFSLLGAIVNSTPVYVPAGNDGLVVVGANDGMLHGFNAADGSETFAYLPSILLDTVGQLRISPYQPRHFVDGELRHRDVGTSTTPQHIVAGGLGAGGKGIFVLDVTTPATPTVIRELSGTNEPHVGGTIDGAMGHVHGRPTIARLPDGSAGGRWFVVAGNGYNSTADRAMLVMVPIDGGLPVFVETDGSTGNGLSAPSLVDATGNGIVDYGYAGDLQGNLWRFEFPATGGVPTVTKLYAAGPSRPITVEPDIGLHPDTQTGFMVYFGTGSLLSVDDIQNTSQQAVYGIWDRGVGTTVTDDRLVTQTLTTASVTWTVPDDAPTYCGTDDVPETSTTTVRFVANQQAPSWGGATPDLGWRVTLPRAGERLIGHPQVRAGRVQFVTTNPYDMIDTERAALDGSGSFIMQLDLATGGNAKAPVSLFDLNKNCRLDDDDGLPEPLTVDATTVAAGTFPVGVNLGPYHIAQPAFARVRFNPLIRSVVDGVYINALQLPLPNDPQLRPPHGPLDVMTDSAFGVAHPSNDPMSEPLREPGENGRKFPEASGPTKPFVFADGLGHRVDGHSFAYNHHHGVDHVDLFDLEPQRTGDGIGTDRRLDVAAKYRDANEDFHPLGPAVNWESNQELNRVTEVNIPDGQRFIVMVTNADLSQSNEIQIGCNRWPVYEYQTMMMQILRRDSSQWGADLAAAGLIHTLDSIRPDGTPTLCPDTGLPSTIRITPTETIGTPDATMATLPGCVNNTDRYAITTGGAGSRHLTRKSNLISSLLLHETDPHVTRNQGRIQGGAQNAGYRWRNGALTVQLLAVNPDNSPAFVLQDAEHLPRGGGIEGQDQGWGGAYAKAFNIVTAQGQSVVVPITDGLGQPATATSGMLYELSMFWHWGDMIRIQQSGGVNPVCYGASSYNTAASNFGAEFFTPARYMNLTEELAADTALQERYVSLLQDLQSDNPAIVQAALVDLADMFADNPNIATYHLLRYHVPLARQLQGHPNLIAIDSGGLGTELVDGTPVEVVDIERDLLPSLGPNYQPGRRSWIDLVPE